MRWALVLTGITSVLRANLTKTGHTLLYKLIVLISIVCVAGCTSVSTLFFYPQKTLISSPTDVGLEYQDVWLNAQDATQLHAWWIPAQGNLPDTNTMVLYLHGNAENISSHSHSIYWLANNGVSILALDYRGFGASQGKAIMPDIFQDIEAAATWMKQQYPEKDLIILGQSIGTVMAINFTAQAAEKYQIQALILDAPLTGIATAARSAMSQNFVGWLIWPFTVLIPKQWDPVNHIAKIDLPVLIMHSPKDTIIPYKQGQALYAQWQNNQPKQQLCWLDSRGPHVMSFAFPDIRKATLEFIKTQQCQE